MKALHAGALFRNHGILCRLQCLPVTQLLLVIAKDQAQQHGGEGIEQQQHPPGMFDEGISRTIGKLREGGQLHQLHHHTKRKVMTRMRRGAATLPPLPCQHPEHSRQQNDRDTDWSTDAAQLVAINRRKPRSNGCRNPPTHHTGHREHNRTAVEDHARRKVHRVHHPQQGHPAKQDPEQHLAVQRGLVEA